MSITEKRKFLDEFMDWKDKILSDALGNISRHEYYNDNDKEALMSLDDGCIEMMYTGLMNTYYNLNDGVKLRDDDICIFCLLNNCLECLYHDKCNEAGSTWHIIIDCIGTGRDGNKIVTIIGEEQIMEYLTKEFEIEDV